MAYIETQTHYITGPIPKISTVEGPSKKSSKDTLPIQPQACKNTISSETCETVSQ